VGVGVGVDDPVGVGVVEAPGDGDAIGVAAFVVQPPDATITAADKVAAASRAMRSAGAEMDI
jgi:hypothetical protein